jgi:hypothetical protein
MMSQGSGGGRADNERGRTTTTIYPPRGEGESAKPAPKPTKPAPVAEELKSFEQIMAEKRAKREADAAAGSGGGGGGGAEGKVVKMPDKMEELRRVLVHTGSHTTAFAW